MTAERGSASLLPVGIALVVGFAVITTALTGGGLMRSRAESAADLVALAAAGALLQDPGPCEVGRVVADRNSAQLLECRLQGSVVQVRVAVPTPKIVSRLSGWRRVEAKAAAELLPATPSDLP